MGCYCYRDSVDGNGGGSPDCGSKERKTNPTNLNAKVIVQKTVITAVVLVKYIYKKRV